MSVVTLAAFGVTGAMLGGANIYKGEACVVIGDLAAMGITTALAASLQAAPSMCNELGRSCLQPD